MRMIWWKVILIYQCFDITFKVWQAFRGGYLHVQYAHQEDKRNWDNAAPLRATICSWVACLKCRDMSFEDEERPRLLTHVTIPEIVKKVHDIEKWKWRILSRMCVCLRIHHIELREIRLHYYVPVAKLQSLQWMHPVSLSTNDDQVLFFGWKGSCHDILYTKQMLLMDYLTTGQTMNRTYYAALPNKMEVAITKIRPTMPRKEVLFYHDNAPLHCWGKNLINYDYRLVFILFTRSGPFRQQNWN